MHQSQYPSSHLPQSKTRQSSKNRRSLRKNISKYKRRNKMKILILSCSTGGGHNSCAKYIQEELKENNIPCEFKDFYNIVNANAKELSEKI